jgi:predicted MFS family arabinose efflux permease
MQLAAGAIREPGAGLLVAGQLISQVCDKMMTVGLVWMLAERYPAAIIPWFLGVSALPHLLLAWHAGGWATALGPLRTLISTDAFRGAVFLALAAAWPYLGAADAQIAWLFGASFVANVAGALFNPTILSFPVLLTAERHVQQLTSLIESCFSIGAIAGPALAAIAYPWLGVQGLFAFNGISFLIAAALEAGIRMPVPITPVPAATPVSAASAEHSLSAQAPSPRRGTGPPGMSGPLHATGPLSLTGPLAAVPQHAEAAPDTALTLLRRDGVLALMLGGFLGNNLFLTPLMVFLPIFVKDRYHGGVETLAGLEVAIGAGTIAATLLLAALHIDWPLGKRISLGMSLMSAAYIGFALSGSPVAGAACLAALGFFLAATNVFCLTFFQTRVAPQNVPILMSLVNLISVASLPLSMTVLGLIAGKIDIGTVAVVCSAGFALVTAIVVARRPIRQLA